jgi:hypothetical protein
MSINTNMFRRTAWAVVILAALAIGTSVAAQGNLVQRPLSDFLNAQGKTSNFFYPCPDELGWINNPTVTFGWFDYTGKCAEVLGLDLGTNVSGSVTERLLKDGRAQVQVILHTTNAYVWARAFDWWIPDPAGTDMTWFGYRPGNYIGPDVATGECHLDLVFYNPPNSPLPDMVALSYTPENFVSMKFRGNATGPLRAAFGVPEGTPGHLVVSQTGFFNKKGNPLPAGDGWPAEIVNLTIAH